MVPWLLFVAVIAKVLRVTAVRSEVEELDTEMPKRTSGDLPTKLSKLTENLSEKCQRQMSSLLEDLMEKCQEAHAPRCESDLIDMIVADESGNYGTRDFLSNSYEWFKNLAATKQDGMLWAGFWPGGEPQRTSKDALMGFAELMDKDVVHPNSELGRIVADAGDLQECNHGKKASECVFGFWTHASEAFVAQMLWKKQSSVLMLVNKDLDPSAERSFQKSVLGFFELPNLGKMVVGSVWNTNPQSPSDPWLPQLVVVDLQGACKKLKDKIRQTLGDLVQPKDPRTNPRYAALLSWLKHKPVICKNCVSPCKLDQQLAMQLKKDLGSAEKSFQKKVQKFGSFRKMIETEKTEEKVNLQKEHSQRTDRERERKEKKRQRKLRKWDRRMEAQEGISKAEKKWQEKFESRNSELAKKQWEEKKRSNNPWFKGKK